VGCLSMEWIEMARDNDRRLALVKTVVSFRVP
jgi:hypothetical protein